MSTNKVPKLKYRIKELLDSQPYDLRSQAKKDLIFLLDVSERTLERIMKAKTTDKQEMSATNLLRIAEYFGIDPKEVLTIDVSIQVGFPDLVL